MSFFPGIKIADRYELLAELGVPAARTYRARDTHADREVVLKIFRAPHPGPEVDTWIHRILLETQALAALHHPNLVSVLDAQAMGPDSLFVVEELLEGHTPADELELAGALPAPRAQAVLLGVLDGLEELHRRGIVHRNLKPSSVMMVKGASADVPKLMDIGLGRPVAGEQHTPFVAGALAYLAPEQLRGELVDPRTDVFSAGALAFVLLAGRSPFTDEEARARLGDGPTPKVPPLATAGPAVPITLSAMVARATQLRPEERFDGASALRAALIGRMPRTSSAVDTPLLRPTGPRSAPPALPDPFEPVRNAIPAWFDVRKAVIGAAGVALVLFAFSTWWGRIGSTSAMNDLITATTACARTQPGMRTMTYLVGRGGSVEPLADSPCGSIATVSHSSHPTLVTLTTGADGIASAVAYRVDLDWEIATADSGLPEGDLEDALDSAVEDVVVCIARNPGTLVAGDGGEFIPINFDFDRQGRVKKVVAGYNYGGPHIKRWQGTVPEVKCIGGVAAQLRLPPFAGGGANTKVNYAAVQIARWP